jgi:hypothetical protein
MGELLQSSQHSRSRVAQNSIFVQVTCLVMHDTKYKFHVGTNLLYLSLKAFRVSCQSCCSVCTDADVVCPGNIFCCEIVILCLEYITSCTSLRKRQTVQELFLDVFFETVSVKYK